MYKNQQFREQVHIWQLDLKGLERVQIIEIQHFVDEIRKRKVKI